MSKRRTYSVEFKSEAISLALKSPSIIQVARDLGIPGATLHSWITKAKSSSSNTPNLSKKIDLDALLEDNKRLQKENINLKEEREILKKAATYFAQHQK